MSSYSDSPSLTQSGFQKVNTPSSMESSSSSKDGSSVSSQKSASYSGLAIAGLIIGIIALILVIVIWAIYFAEREGFLSTTFPIWKNVVVGSTSSGAQGSSVDIDGENYTLYEISSNTPSSVSDFTIQGSSNNEPVGSWFAIFNNSSSNKTIRGNFAVAGDSYTLPSKNTAFIVKLNSNGQLKIVIPTNVSSSS